MPAPTKEETRRIVALRDREDEEDEEMVPIGKIVKMENAGASIGKKRLNPVQTKVLVTTIRSLKRELDRCNTVVKSVEMQLDVAKSQRLDAQKKYDEMIEGIEFDIMLEDI
jgi:hypothetical protein